jgi:glutaredoxin-like protein NrdH
MVKVFTLPSCPQCETTKSYLKKNQIPFEEINLADDPDATEYVKQLGYASAPIVVAGDEHWSGFRFEKLRSLNTAVLQ